MNRLVNKDWLKIMKGFNYDRLVNNSRLEIMTALGALLTIMIAGGKLPAKQFSSPKKFGNNNLRHQNISSPKLFGQQKKCLDDLHVCEINAINFSLEFFCVTQKISVSKNFSFKKFQLQKIPVSKNNKKK